MKRIELAGLLSLSLAGALLAVDLSDPEKGNAAVSMHMNFEHSITTDVQITEVRIPSDGIATNSYYETIGFRGNRPVDMGNGYAGIQETSDAAGNRVHIFSIWDPFGNNHVPYVAHGMESEIFGGEGVGSKTWCKTDDPSHPLYWQPNVWYTHVVKAWDVGSETHYGFFVRDGVSNKWRHLSTIAVTYANIRISSSSDNDAFLENWSAGGLSQPYGGKVKRAMHLKNSWRRSETGSWEAAQFGRYSVNATDITHYAGRSRNYGTNWDAGIGNDATGSYYYMVSGGTSTSPSSPLSYSSQVASNQSYRFNIPVSESTPNYTPSEISSLNYTDFQNGSMEVLWDIDSMTVPQFSYTLEVFDNASMSGTPLVTSSSYTQPEKRSDTLNISSLDMTNAYYLKLSVTDIFGNIATPEVTTIGNGTVSEYLKVTDPNGGESYIVEDNVTISWSTNLEATDSLEISLLDNGGEVLAIAREEVAKGSYEWTIPSEMTESNNYSIFISGIEADTLMDISDGVFTISVPDSNFILLEQNLLTVDFVDSEQSGADNAKENVLDGNSSTFWHTLWGDTDIPPHEIILEADQTYNLSGIRYLPRQDGPNGRINEYEIYVSTDNSSWKLVSEGNFTNSANEQEVTFEPVAGKYLKLVALSEQSLGAWTSIAELNVLYSAYELGVFVNKEAPVASNRSLIRSLSGRTVNLNLKPGAEYTFALIQMNGRTVHKQRVTGSANGTEVKLHADIGTGVYLMNISGAGVQRLQRISLN